jgi:hypothetical protein
MGKCIPATELRKATQTSVSLRDSLLKFVQAFGVQTTHTAICNAQSRLDVRLARWLLMAHDRIGDDTLPLTHEFLSIMLGVRRGARGRQSLRHSRGRTSPIDQVTDRGRRSGNISLDEAPASVRLPARGFSCRPRASLRDGRATRNSSLSAVLREKSPARASSEAGQARRA